MISHLPRVTYAAMPSSKDWTTRTSGGRTTIIINEALDENGRREAERAAREYLKGSLPGWVPLPVIVGIGWLGRQARGPVGSAVLASAMTAAVIVGLDGDREPPAPRAQAPITVTASPSSASTPPASPGPTPSLTRSRSPSRGVPTSQPPVTATVSQTPTRPVRTPAPTPSPRTTASPPPSGEATMNPAPTTAPPDEGEPPPATAGPSPTAEPPPTVAADGCDGIGLRVDLDPIANLDACLLG